VIDKYVPSASTFAPDIDNLILVILGIVGFWFLLAEFVFFGLILKFKEEPGRKAQYVSGEKPEEKKWVSIPHYATLIFDVLIVVMAVKVWHNVKIEQPPADETVRIVAQQWAWTFEHAGKDGDLAKSDDNIALVDELHVEVGKTYHFELTSRDVLHSFSVPVFRLKQDALPGRVVRGWFKATQTGQFDIQCTEICGIGHGIMPARIIVETPEQHAAWLESAPQYKAKPLELITGYEEPKDDGKVGAVAPTGTPGAALARTDINTQGELAP
jgi:cytochrome c oxidase subunit 2